MDVNWLPAANVMLTRAYAFTNALSPIVVTSTGIVMAVKSYASLNAELPMYVTPAGMIAVPLQEL
jgi:hypothetical protein